MAQIMLMKVGSYQVEAFCGASLSLRKATQLCELCLRIMLANYDKCQAGVRGVSDTKPELGMDICFLLNWHGNCLIELPCAGAGRPRQTA